MLPGQAEEALQRSETALVAARRSMVQAEHGARSHEAAAQKLRSHLADKVQDHAVISYQPPVEAAWRGLVA